MSCRRDCRRDFDAEICLIGLPAPLFGGADGIVFGILRQCRSQCKSNGGKQGSKRKSMASQSDAKMRHDGHTTDQPIAINRAVTVAEKSVTVTMPMVYRDNSRRNAVGTV